MLYLHLAICLVLWGPLLHAQNLVIDDTSPSWSYSPPVCQYICDGSQAGTQQSWWQLANQRNTSAMQGFFNLTETATNLVGATASMNFRGTAIYYYGNVAPWGGVMAVTVDGNTTDVNTTNSGPEQRQSLVYSQTGLDGTQQHTLTVKMLGGTFIDVDRVDITPPSTTASPTASVTPSAITTTTGQSAVKPNVGVIVGSVIAAATVLGLCILLGAWWIHRRKPRGVPVEPFPVYPQNTAAEHFEPRMPALTPQPEVMQFRESSFTATSFSAPQSNDPLLEDRDYSPEPPPYVAML